METLIVCLNPNATPRARTASKGANLDSAAPKRKEVGEFQIIVFLSID